jgi:hypothetical protein
MFLFFELYYETFTMKPMKIERDGELLKRLKSSSGLWWADDEDDETL